jgi:DHA1 family bicyclomycin/chloramphenicol resistance-like MFS transporter
MLAKSHEPLRFAPWLLLLGALTAIGPLSIDMYLPSFPSLEKELGTGVQLSLASFFIGMAMGQVLYGSFSDRFGRKPPLLIGLSLFVLASFACSQATTMNELIIGRFLQGFGGCAGMVISRAVVRDRCEPSQAAQAFSMLMLVMGLAPILAPLAGSWLLVAYGWQSIFWFKSIFASLCLLAVYFSLAETHHARAQPLQLGKVLSDYGHLLVNRTFMGYTLSSGLTFSGMFAYIAGSPHVFIELNHLSPTQYSWIFGSNAFGFIAASQLNAYLLRRGYAMLHILRTAIYFPALASSCLLVAEVAGMSSLPLLLIGFFSYIASLGFISPNAGAAAMANQGHQAGTASALMGVLTFGLASIIGAILGLWHSASALPILTLMTICGVGGLLWHRLVLPKTVVVSP